MMEADDIFTFPDPTANDTDATKQVVQGTRSPDYVMQKEQPSKSLERSRKQMLKSDVSATFPETTVNNTDALKQVVQGGKKSSFT
jgi:hypothetical protein